MKRFTETDKWRDPWFRRLPHTLKLGYLYLLDSVDNAGVWDPDFDAADFSIGAIVPWDDLKVAMGDRLQILPNKKWHVSKFVGYQFGELSEACKPHAQVIRLLSHHGIDRVSKEYPKGIHTLKDKDKDKDSLQLRIGAIFRRKPETPLGASEVRAMKNNRAAIEATSEDDWQLLEAFYKAPQTETFARKDLAALVNNWNGEIDKARLWRPKHHTAAPAMLPFV